MSILDDAIREHLELIRRRGATDSEVARLEDEAFGPPTRPDEADFPESEEAAAHEDVTTMMPASETGEQDAERVSDEGEAGGVGDGGPATGPEDPTAADIAGGPEAEHMLIEPEEEPPAERRDEEPVAEPRDEEPVAEPRDEEPVAEEHPIVEE